MLSQYSPYHTAEAVMVYLRPSIIALFGQDYESRLHSSGGTDMARNSMGQLITKTSFRLVHNEEKSLGLRILSFARGMDEPHRRSLPGYSPTNLVKVMENYPQVKIAHVAELQRQCETLEMSCNYYENVARKNNLIVFSGKPKLAQAPHACVVEVIFAEPGTTMFRRA